MANEHAVKQITKISHTDSSTTIYYTDQSNKERFVKDRFRKPTQHFLNAFEGLKAYLVETIGVKPLETTNVEIRHVTLKHGQDGRYDLGGAVVFYPNGGGSASCNAPLRSSAGFGEEKLEAVQDLINEAELFIGGQRAAGDLFDSDSVEAKPSAHAGDGHAGAEAETIVESATIRGDIFREDMRRLFGDETMEQASFKVLDRKAEADDFDLEKELQDMAPGAVISLFERFAKENMKLAEADSPSSNPEDLEAGTQRMLSAWRAWLDFAGFLNLTELQQGRVKTIGALMAKAQDRYAEQMGF